SLRAPQAGNFQCRPDRLIGDFRWIDFVGGPSIACSKTTYLRQRASTASASLVHPFQRLVDFEGEHLERWQACDDRVIFLSGAVDPALAQNCEDQIERDFLDRGAKTLLSVH